MGGPYTPDPNDPTRPLNSDEVQYGAEELRKIKLKANGTFTTNTVTATSYTLLSTDIGNLVYMQNGGTITIPAGLPAGLVGITGNTGTNLIAGVGVTLVIPASLSNRLYEQNAFAVIMRRAANTWLLSGNLELIPSA